ncbi:MAG TPA: hypothetical protein VEL28_17045 [Candidatus Binatia bacterium]|nr:hypothetical protein [Candidatus Binatia bacterium]
MTMQTGAQQTFRHGGGLAALFYGLLAAPFALGAHMFVNYAFVHWACARVDHGWLGAVAALFLLISVSGAAVALRTWQRAGSDWPDASSDVVTRSRFLSAIGLGVSVMTALLIAAQWLAMAYIDPCMR